jgi:ATP-dependent DNA helicase RecQ
MTYGLADVVNQRRMIDESPAEADFKQRQRAKLEALLALAEAHDCRRVRLLSYFGQASAPCAAWQHRCDNCQNPPATWDATEAARKALSCVFRFRQHGGITFGAGHLIDVLRGKTTDKVAQHGHATLSTFGVGADLSEQQWRGVLRQLVAMGCLRAEGEYNTLELDASAREVLRGEVQLLLKVPTELSRSKSVAKSGRSRVGGGAAAGKPPPVPLDAQAMQRFAALKAWRGEVAREHNLPAYVVFHDATLAQMAREYPQSPVELAGISGVGAKKLEAYGSEILRVLGAAE